MVKHSLEKKLKAIDLFQNEHCNSHYIAKQLGVGSSQLVDIWIDQYQKYGKAGLKVKRSKRKYSGQFKLMVLNWRKVHRKSYRSTAIHFDIFNIGTISNWQKRFNEGGVEALFVKQGRPVMHPKKKKRKPISSELDELEKLRLENHQLLLENRYLKKLAALVHKRGHRSKKGKL